MVFTGEDIGWPRIAAALEVYRDPSRALTADELGTVAFTPLGRDVADFGYTKDVIWLRFGIENRSADEDLVMGLRENFLQLYEAWLIPPGGPPQRIDAQDDTTPFSNRQIAFPELATPFVIAPGATAEVAIRFWSGGSSELSWRVTSRDNFTTWSAKRTARNFVFYGMALLFSTAAAISFVVTRRAVFAAYSGYTLAGLLFIMHADGNTFQYLWPDAPRFNAFASVPLGGFLIFSGLLFARSFLGTREYHPSLDKVLVGMMAVTVTACLSTLVFDTQFIKRLLILLSMLTTCVLALSGVVVARTRFREVRFYLLAWSFAFIASGVMTLRHWLGVEFSEEVTYDAIRIVLILDAALMGLAILDRIDWLKQSQQAAMETSLANARKTVDLTRRLQDIEQKMAISETLAVSQERALTQTAHDIRQPLHALRLNLREIAETEPTEARVADVEETLGYLEALVSENLADVLIAGAGQAAAARTEIGPILASVVDMFDADARAKGLALRCVESSATTSVPPLALMRMLTNLVSNAIKATQSGGVLIGLRRGARPRLEVHDTGPGFSAAQRATGLRGDGQSTGLGLGIVAQIAGETGVEIEHVSPQGGGTVLRLWLPEDAPEA